MNTNPDYIKTLLKLTKVSSSDVINAAIAHLCEEKKQDDAASEYNVKQEAVARLVTRIRKLDEIVTEAQKYNT